MKNNVSHGKVAQRWCDACGTLVLGKGCGCSSVTRAFEINSPGDIRPCMDDGYEIVTRLFMKHFGTSSPIDGRMMFFNKIPGDDRTDEIIAHGSVIAVLRYDLRKKDFSMELRQAGAELFAAAEKNTITLGSVSGHLKGKNISGSDIQNVTGKFEAGDPLIIRKGGKINSLGFYKDSEVQAPPYTQLVMNEIVISGSRANPNVSAKVLNMFEAGVLTGDKVVTHTFPLERYPDALDTFVNKKDGAIKVVITPEADPKSGGKVNS